MRAGGPGLEHLIADIARWFSSRRLTDAVVGFSGGVDSTLTALLLNAAGVATHLVVAEAPGQRYASSLGGREGAMRLARQAGLAAVVHRSIALTPGVTDSAFHEAALPIQRNAVFYGEAASLRAQGRHPCVVGTANLSEAAFLGFWGKASDAAQDVYPISGLTKTDVRSMAVALGAPGEALDAPPSGDLQFEDTDDRRMIGATYAQIDRVIAAAEHNPRDLGAAFEAVEHPARFADNIVRNAFKYDLPFPGAHLSPRLERFRQTAYPVVLALAREATCTTS